MTGRVECPHVSWKAALSIRDRSKHTVVGALVIMHTYLILQMINLRAVVCKLLSMLLACLRSISVQLIHLLLLLLQLSLLCLGRLCMLVAHADCLILQRGDMLLQRCTGFALILQLLPKVCHMGMQALLACLQLCDAISHHQCCGSACIQPSTAS